MEFALKWRTDVYRKRENLNNGRSRRHIVWNWVIELWVKYIYAGYGVIA